MIFLYRTITNVTKKAPLDTAANAKNKENESGTSGAGPGGVGQEENPGEPEEGHNAENYNARQARKCTKKKEQVDVFQERLLMVIETPQPQVELAPPSPLAKHEYLDVSFEAMAFKMEVLSKDEIMDVVEDLQNLVNRACREKR